VYLRPPKDVAGMRGGARQRTSILSLSLEGHGASTYFQLRGSGKVRGEIKIHKTKDGSTSGGLGILQAGDHGGVLAWVPRASRLVSNSDHLYGLLGRRGAAVDFWSEVKAGISNEKPGRWRIA